MKKNAREEIEFLSLFTDERYAKRAFKSLLDQSLRGPAKPLPQIEDAKGNITPASLIDSAAYRNVVDRLKAQGYSRSPMQSEVIMEAAVLRARLDTNSLSLLLDRTAGKVKEEINVSSSAYEEMTDEELVLLSQYRKAKLITENVTREEKDIVIEGERHDDVN